MASVAKRTWTHKSETKAAWVVRYVDRSGTHRQKTFPSKKTADRFKLTVDVERAERGSIGYVQVTTVKAVAQEFAAQYESRFEDGKITRGTLANVTTGVRAVTKKFGGHKVGDLEIGEIVSWYRELKQRGLGSNSARRRVETLKHILDFAKRRGVTRENPALEAMAEIGGRTRERIKTFSTEQIHTLLLAASNRRSGQYPHTWRLTETVVHVAAFCGLRIGEILALTRENIDLENRVLRVRHTLNAWDELTLPKTPSSVREVPVPAHVAELLRRWLEDFYIANERGLAFRSTVSRTGKPGGSISTGAFNIDYWGKLLKHAGLHTAGDPFHFHALRHFAGSWWLSSGVPVPDVSALMGHADPKITMGIYAHALLSGAERSDHIDRATTLLLAGPSRPAAQDVHNARETQLIQ